MKVVSLNICQSWTKEYLGHSPYEMKYRITLSITIIELKKSKENYTLRSSEDILQLFLKESYFTRIASIHVSPSTYSIRY